MKFLFILLLIINSNLLLSNQTIVTNFSNNDYNNSGIYWLPDNPQNLEVIYPLNVVGGVIVRLDGDKPLIQGAIELSKFKIQLDEISEPINQMSVTSDLLNVTPIWDDGYNGSEAIVAVIDTGVDFTHPALVDKMYLEKSFKKIQFGYETNEGTEDNHGHGTSVASLIAANDINNLNKRGMAYGSKIVNAKVGIENGFITAAALIAAIDWAASLEEVDVISISMGEPEAGSTLDVLELAVNAAVKLGKMVVASAGNNGKNGAYTSEPHSIGSPGSAPQVITVGAVDNSKKLALFSSEGPTYGWEAKPDIVAPGVSVPVAKLGGGYSVASGTSFSTPLVSGTIALLISTLKQKNLTYNPGLIKAAITSSASDLGLSWQMQGNGLANAANALKLLESSNVLAKIYPDIIPHAARIDIHAGEKIVHPITLVSSETNGWKVEKIAGNASNFVSLTLDNTIEFSNIVPVSISTSRNNIPGFYTGFVILSTSEVDVQFNITINILPPAELRLLIDLVHSPWDSIIHSTSKLRVERLLGIDLDKFVSLLRGKNIWVEEFLEGYLDEEYLNQFDILWMPSAFALTTPSFFDHELSRTTLLTTEELFALNNFIENGGRILVDFGGTSIGDESFDNIMPDHGSIHSLLSLFGIEVSNIGQENNLNTVSTLNSSTIGNTSHSTIGGRSSLKYGIPVTSHLDELNSVAWIGAQSRAFIINARNWRDDIRMGQMAQNGPYNFVNNVIDWILKSEGIQYLNFEKAIMGLVISGSIFDNGTIDENALVINATINDVSIPIENLEFKSTGEFSFILRDIFTGDLQLSLSYKSDYIQTIKKIELDAPIISLIDQIEDTDNIIWTFNVQEVSTIPKYNVRILINDQVDVAGLSYTFDQKNLVVSLDKLAYGKPGVIKIDVEVIDRYSNFGKYIESSTTVTPVSIPSSSHNTNVSTKTPTISKSTSTEKVNMQIIIVIIAVVYQQKRRKLKLIS